MALWALVLLGFVLRLIGLNFGLPDLLHADEPIVVNHALAYGTGDLNPHFFQIPPLISYVLFVVYGLYFAGGWAAGFFENSRVFAEMFFQDPSNFYLLGRFMIGVVPGTLSIVLLYRLARRMVSKEAALWAAALLAVCFLPVRNAHYIYVDTALCMTLILAMGAMLNVFERGTMRDYLLAGIWMGLCTAVKYNAALIAVPFLLAHALRPMSRRQKVFSAPMCIGLGAGALVFALCNPFAILDFSFFWKSLSRQGEAQAFVGWLHHARYSLAGGMGVFLMFAGLAGIGLAVVIRNKKAWIPLSFVLVFYAAIAVFGQEHDRYVLPLIPFLLIFAGLFIQWMLWRFREAPAKAKWARVLVLLFLWLPMLIKTGYSDWLFLQTDSRTLAREWIEENIRPGTGIALDHTFYGPRLKPSMEQLQEKMSAAGGKETGRAQKHRKLEMMLQVAKAWEPRYDLYFLSDEEVKTSGFLFAEPKIPFDFEALRREGIAVVVKHHLGARSTHFGFWAQVEQHVKDSYAFSPYRQEWQDFSLEPQVRTGGAFLWPEMLSRKSNGEFVRVYLLE